MARQLEATCCVAPSCGRNPNETQVIIILTVAFLELASSKELVKYQNMALHNMDDL